MAAREIIVKKYVVRLSGEEREQLVALARKGRGLAQRLMKARLLLKADASEAGEGWSDNQIIEALETSASMVYRVRKQLVEEGLEAVLSRKPRAAPAVPRNLRWREGSQADCLGLFRTSQGPRTLDIAVVGNKVVELNIVDRASDSKSLGQQGTRRPTARSWRPEDVRR